MTMKRFTLDLTSTAASELDKLAEDLGVTKSELMRRALGLMKVAVRETKDGTKKVAIANAENQVEQVLILRD
jgi:predicted transcriptional regulator